MADLVRWSLASSTREWVMDYLFSALPTACVLDS
jgi:hypothetical protein